MSARRLALLLPLAACSGGSDPPAMCEVRTPLVDHTMWTPVPVESDPFAVAAGIRCDTDHMRMEDFSGELSFTVETRGCSWATVQEPVRAAVTAGEMLHFRLWYFSQTNFEVAEADLLVALGSTPLWSDKVPLPATTGGLLLGTLAAPRDIAVGEPILFHVANHGTNSWNLIEVSRSRLQPCPRDGGT